MRRLIRGAWNLCGVEGFSNGVQVQAFLPDFLKKMCDKN